MNEQELSDKAMMIAKLDNVMEHAFWEDVPKEVTPES